MRRPGRIFRPAAPILAVLATVLVMAAPCAVAAQSSYSPVIRVNDKAITAYELDQRQRLLRALGAPGDLAREARDRLIDERLQVQAAEELGLAVTDDAIQAGIEEYAQRANTDAATFLSVLARNGVAKESIEDFVRAGLLWREVVRTKFGPLSQVTDDEVDRAIALAGQSGGARVLISEIVLPARNDQELAQAEARAVEIGRIKGFDAFAAAARNFSASQSRERGGRIDWLPLGQLPPPLRAQLLTLPPGGITEPLRVPNAVAIFQLRALEELPPQRPETVALDYAEFLIPDGSAAEAQKVAGEIDTCDDLYGVAKGLSPERLIRETRAPAEIPADVASELNKLDEDEVSTALTRGTARVVLMLCGRTSAQSEAVDRGQIRSQLINQRAASYADAYLAELRADAGIVGAQ